MIPSYSFSIVFSKIIACTISGMGTEAAVRHWKFLFIAMISIAGFATEIFWEITFLNSVKVAKGPVCLKAALGAIHAAFSVALLAASTATDIFTQSRIDPYGWSLLST